MRSLHISFLGPDGSGKSTIIKELEKKTMPFKTMEYFHLKPIKQTSNNNKNTTDPHSQKLYSPFKSYIKLLYFIYQYNIGWIKNILPLKKKSSLIIFDRYYDDLLVDYKRYRYGGNIWIAKFIKYLIPKPDLYFILTSKADIIYQRKQEVSFEELQRQIKEYELLAISKKYVLIDVNRPPSIIAKEIENILIRSTNGK